MSVQFAVELTHSSFIDHLVTTMRLAAVTSGTFVILDFTKHLNGADEVPPYDRRRNALAWALVAIGAIVGGLGFTFTELRHPIALATWTGWAVGLTWRAASRAKQPWLIWAALALLSVATFVISFMGGAYQ